MHKFYHFNRALASKILFVSENLCNNFYNYKFLPYKNRNYAIFFVFLCIRAVLFLRVATLTNFKICGILSVHGGVPASTGRRDVGKASGRVGCLKNAN